MGVKKEILCFYARSGNFSDNVIAKIQLELVGWRCRRKAKQILNDIRSSVQNIKGVMIDV
ncbi:multidrug resistance D domain protein [Wolbachia endosymbiont of Trichogramma pretiosum]|nr:multidrug resistance D domain protein [Wolbachia endosymbiont of Trichogramma pretiosum]